MRILLACLVLLPFAARAAELVDAAGRHVRMPAHIARVLPAGPPAAVLMEVLAPDLMIGWPHPPAAPAAAWLPDAVARLPAAPPADAKDADAVRKAAPDLILDYGDVTSPWAERDQAAQAATGVPTLLLDGALAATPQVLRELGDVLGRAQRARELADTVQAILDRPGGGMHSVVYARGAEGLTVLAPGTIGTQVFALLHWRVLAPSGKGTFRRTNIDAIRTLDPDVLIFADPAMRRTVANSPDWRAIRAVRERRAYTAPNMPFGWIEEPGSVNRVLGVAWLSGNDALAAAEKLYPLLYGRALDAAQVQVLRETLQPIEP